MEATLSDTQLSCTAT